MIRRYESDANVGLGAGFLLNVIAAGLLGSGAGDLGAAPKLVLFLVLMNVGGYALFVYGCVMYARAKDRTGWWGAFGLLSLIGLIVLSCLKDRARGAHVAGPRGFAPIMSGDGPPRA